MLTLRCTRKLLARLQQPPAAGEGAPSTTLLGDWYANLVVLRREQLLLLVAEKTLLPVVVTSGLEASPRTERGARSDQRGANNRATNPLDELVPRFRLATRAVLLALGVAEPAVDREVAAMEPVNFGKTRSRQLLGSMTDFAFLLEARKPAESLLDTSLWLADAPCRPLKMESLRDATLALFAAG